MSHLPERKEKICLNCKSVIYGRFCHICGQENTEPKETFWGLITHFIYDITHFDGKFFTSVKSLLFRPGYLSHEYLRGRRAAYLNPVRMYVFTSAFFFIIFFSFITTSPEEKAAKAEKELVATRKSLNKRLVTVKDSTERKDILKKIAETDSALIFIKQTGLTPKKEGDIIGLTGSGSVSSEVINVNSLPKTLHEYDSIQNSRPKEKRHGWLSRQIKRKSIAINMKYRGRSKEFFSEFVEKFRHSIPQMMFVSLPLVAFVLQLLYIRRKQYYYVNHVIFAIHEYIAIFVLLLVFYGLGGLKKVTGWEVFTWLAIATFISIFFYIYKSMRNFYRQGRGKTIVKFLLLNFTVLILFILLSAVFIVNSLLHM
jgi:hypothetical protein